MPKPAVYIGTSGWNYQHWRSEVYPRGLKSREWLPYLADRLDAIEINSSFYRIPSESSLRSWQNAAPARVRFAVKMWRGITHYRKLANCEDLLDRFLRVVDQLAVRRSGPLLVQLPPQQQKDLSRLGAFLKLLRDVSSRRWKVAVEFRNDSWLSPDVYRLLDRHRASICLHDRTGGAANEPNDSGFIYVRRHGPGGGRYRGGYASSELRRDARRVRQWLREGKLIYVFFNNDTGGHAFRDGQALRELLHRSAL